MIELKAHLCYIRHYIMQQVILHTSYSFWHKAQCIQSPSSKGNNSWQSRCIITSTTDHLEKIRNNTIKNDLEKKRKSKQRYDSKARGKDINFQISKLVLAKNLAISNNKLKPKWLGPYKIIKLGANSVVIKDSKSSRNKFKAFNKKNIKPYAKRNIERLSGSLQPGSSTR